MNTSSPFAVTRRFRSVAVWPKDAGLCLGHPLNESHDIHASYKYAQAICRRLEAEGFGGNGRIFPVSTRVEEISDDSTEAAQYREDCHKRAIAAIFEIENSIALDSEERRKFFTARIALAEAWDALPESLKPKQRFP